MKAIVYNTPGAIDREDALLHWGEFSLFYK